MLAAWNERDPDQIRGHLERALAPDVEFIDPSISTRGIDEFEANVRNFRARFPDAVCSRSSGVDGHHHLFRYDWAIHQGDKVVLPGFVGAEIDADGLVRRVLGFFGPLPPLS
ncbi:MAG: nuclear transport factor 2 family protein [Myxococcota bacterium]